MSVSNHEIHELIEVKLQLLSTELSSGKDKDGKEISPVRRKVYRTILGRLIAIREGILRQSGSVEIGLSATIIVVLKSIEKDLPEDANWEIADALKELLPRIVTDDTMYKLLLEEKEREKEAAKSKNETLNLWSEYFDSADLDAQIQGYEKGDNRYQRALVQKRLASLYGIRNDLGRHDRAREGIRVKYLIKMAWILLISILILIFLWYISSVYNSFTLYLVIASVAGAVGALLSRALRLRKLNLITEINTLNNTLFLQAVLGSILAVIVLIILKAGIISISGFDLDNGGTPIYFVIGLLSGFSEPFALGIIEKIAKK